MGGQWLRKDSFSNMYMFLVLEKQHSDIFNKKWKEFEEFKTEKKSVAVEAPEAAVTTTSASGSGTPSAAKGKAKAKAKGAGGPPSEKKAKPSDKTQAAKDLAELEKQAYQIKTQMMKTRMSATSFVQQVQSKVPYEWARNAENVGRLEAAITIMDEMTDFAKEFLFQDMKALKTKTGDFWQGELRDFVETMQPKLADVSNITKELLMMHIAKMGLAGKTSKATEKSKK